MIEGIEIYKKEERLEEVYDFLGRYVRKFHTDDIIVKALKSKVGISFLVINSPGDITYIIELVKNGRDVWDQDLRLCASGAAAHTRKSPKLKPMFTGGKGQKRNKSNSLWSKEGMKIFYLAEKNWRRVYNNRQDMKRLYTWWD